MPSTAHPDAFHFERPAPSWWEGSAPPLEAPMPPLASDAACEVAIIGAGYTGLSAALRLAEAHSVDVRVLEAAEPGWGASGRNGGFACMGGAKLSWQGITARYGLEEARRFHDVQGDSIGLARELCRRIGLDPETAQDGEAELAHLPGRWQGLVEHAAYLKATFGERCELVPREELAVRGLGGPHFHGGLVGERGFGLHPMRYVRGLAREAIAKGAIVHARSRLTGWERHGDRHRLITNGGSISAHHVLVATNGYTPEAVVLDYACGEALSAGRVADACGMLYLAEPAPGVRGRLIARFAPNTKIRVRSLEDVRKMAENSIDLVVMNSVAQYMTPDELDTAFATIKRILKPSGRFVLGDILRPEVGMARDVLALLQFAHKNGFLKDALIGLISTALSDYRELRTRVGLQRYTAGEIMEKLARAGFSASRAPRNIGHNPWRMTFVAHHPVSATSGRSD